MHTRLASFHPFRFQFPHLISMQSSILMRSTNKKRVSVIECKCVSVKYNLPNFISSTQIIANRHIYRRLQNNHHHKKRDGKDFVYICSVSFTAFFIACCFLFSIYEMCVKKRDELQQLLSCESSARLSFFHLLKFNY